MNLEKIKKFIDLAKAEGVSELKFEEDGTKISVNFQQNMNAGVVTNVEPAYSNTSTVSTESQSVDSDLYEIKSPFVGTYYSSSAPGKPTYVKVGDKISTGNTLCILEAMKIMNEIESEVSGEIVEICVENESLVEFGQVLYRVREN